VLDGDVRQQHGIAHAGAESLAQRLLRGEALGKKAGGIGAGAAGLALGGRQHLFQPALAVALPVVGHAPTATMSVPTP
jgi:hypothetical protein